MSNLKELKKLGADLRKSRRDLIKMAESSLFGDAEMIRSAKAYHEALMAYNTCMFRCVKANVDIGQLQKQIENDRPF